MRIVRRLSIVALLIGLGIYWLAYWPLRDKHPVAAPVHGLLALTGMRIYANPDSAAIDKGTILIRDGRIIAVGAEVPVPADAVRLECAACVVTAGFWNVHVHFTEHHWSGAEGAPAARLESQLQDMLTSRGFTTVVDLGSNLRDTIPLRRRIEHGEIAGPRIYTAGAAQYPPHGIPYYLRDTLPKWLVFLLAQPATPAEAARIEERNIADGADLLKLFTGSYVARGTVLPMPLANAIAATEVAHRHGQQVFAHESDARGIRVAIDGGVDVLAHAADTVQGIDDALLRELVARHMAMVPTVKMFRTTVTTNPAYLDPIYAQVRRFKELGGELLFGTDVGYMTDYDTREEFEGLKHCELSSRDMLRMLTTAPARRFAAAAQTGTIEPGKTGDLTVLSADPFEDAANFAAVAYTIRGGKVIWQRKN